MDFPRRIVLVEDNPADIKVISDAVSRVAPSDKLEVFRDGMNAYQFLSRERNPENPVALLVLDLQIPRFHGLDLLEQLKQSPHTRTIPVLVITGSATDKQIDRVYELGANSVVRKITHPQENIRAIEEALRYWLTANVVGALA